MPLYSFDGVRPQLEAAAYIHPDVVLIGQVGVGPGAHVRSGCVELADWRVT